MRFVKWSIIGVLLVTFGCDLPSDRVQGIEKLEDRLNIKLDGMIGINSRIGSVLGYNVRRYNGPMFQHERYYQQFNGMIPIDQATFQKMIKARSYVFGQYGINGYFE